MDHDQIGGWCPKCDAEYAPGVTDCPQCAIPLIGAVEGARRSADEAPPEPVVAGDERWTGRLHVVATACSVAVLGLVVGAVIQAYDADRLRLFGNEDLARWRVRLNVLTQVARPGVAVVALAAGVSLAAAAHLAGRPGRRRVALLVFGSSLLLGVLAAVGIANEVLGWPGTLGPGRAGQASTVSINASALVVAGVACWLTDVWRPTSPGQA